MILTDLAAGTVEIRLIFQETLLALRQKVLGLGPTDAFRR